MTEENTWEFRWHSVSSDPSALYFLSPETCDIGKQLVEDACRGEVVETRGGKQVCLKHCHYLLLSEGGEVGESS